MNLFTRKILLAIAASIFVIPISAIAETQNLPANYMIWRGKVYNLDYMAGKGIAPIAQPIATQSTPPVVATQSRSIRDNLQRVENENARAAIRLEYLQNSS